jgi:catechol 2,3-dioxygenase-like lactoylglutathione lyase family enzyme
MPGIQLESFDHFTLIVADVDASRSFYVDQLGFDEAVRPAFDFPGAWFQLGATMIHVTQQSDLAGQAGWGSRGVRSVSRGHHFAYVTNDFDQAIASIDQMQIRIAAGPQSRPDGARQVYIYDPDDHVIEICSKP